MDVSAIVAAKAAARAALAARLGEIRTISALKRREPNAGAAERALKSLSDAALAFAAQNSDHSEAGQTLARTALAQRVGEAEADRRIEAFIDETPEPGWVEAADIEQNDLLFFGTRRWMMRGVLAAALLSVAIWLGLSWDGPDRERALWDQAIAQGLVSSQEVDAAYQQPTPNTNEPTSQTKLEALQERPGVGPLFEDYNRRQETAGFAGLWSILLFPLYTILLGWRQKPARVLLLRRFNDPQIGKSIESMSKKWLKPYGHVFTLADKHFRRSMIAPFFSWFSFNPFLLVWRVINIPIAFIIRLTDRSRAGPILVRDARDFRNFARRMIDRYGLNLEMERTQRKAIAVRTSDAWWQHVVLLLMHAADVIVVDVTEVASGTEWELQTMLTERVSERVVFIAREDEAADARASLQAHGFGGRAQSLALYKKSGALVDSRAFRAEMRAAMLRKLGRAS